MAIPSKKRQQALREDMPVLRGLYVRACVRFSKESVAKDPTLLWTMRCIEGVQGSLPFQGGLVAQNAGELLWCWRTYGSGEGQ